MSNQEKTDRRVLYTKMFLKEALLELMKDKAIDKITPTELCRKANINRNTFYSHYYTPRDVLAEIEEEFSTQLIESLSSQSTAENFEILQMLKEITHLIHAQKDFCKILLSENGDAAFFENVISAGKPVVLERWRAEGVAADDNGMEMLFSFVVNGSIALIRKWAATDLREPPDKVAVLIERIAYGGIDGMKTAGTPA